MAGFGLTAVLIGGIVAIAGGLVRADPVGAGIGATLLGIGLILTSISDTLAAREDEPSVGRP
jgi:hypothetical protein